ncbi:MAG: PilZ domain-containing protein [Deltaproteobacteria bacterium]|nr:PilZ domain-containing protein [Deltaproteobacteria bacterium]
MMGIERRKHPRFESFNLLSYVCLDENNHALDQGMGRTLNVSEGGILLETPNPIDPKHTLVLTIGDGKVRTGIQFIEMNEATLGTLKRYVKAFGKA